MADHEEVFQKILKKPGVSYPVLTPNIQGFEQYDFKFIGILERQFTN